MQVPPIFYKSTNIVLHENHKGICSGRMVPTSKIYGIGSWTKKSFIASGPGLNIRSLFMLNLAEHLPFLAH